MKVPYWSEAGGDDYMCSHATTDEDVARRARFLGYVLYQIPEADQPQSILEVGAGPGGNLHALQKVSTAKIVGVEPNRTASIDWPNVQWRCGVITEIPVVAEKFDLVLTMGVLIHLKKDDLPKAMTELVRASRRFVLCCEYYNDEWIENVAPDGVVQVRGDFGALMADKGLRPLHHGVIWRGHSPLGDLSWWLMEKTNGS